MAPPVTKRRKLEHSDSEAESEGSFADFDETNAVHDEESDAEDASETSHVDMNGLDEEDDDEDEDMDDEEGDAFEEEADVHPSRKQTPAGKATSESKPPKRPAPSLQDGVYMAETSHSNLFKLQVDELLEQVKLKYGKKEAPAENAMRTLKTIIEQIPSRDPLPVCTRVGNCPTMC
jgi:U3 small nucleolar RNA-associated protein 22